MRHLLKNKLKEQKGFTLIELLAVIVILGIIAAIAIPSITTIIANSKEDAIKADAKLILNAAKLYYTENGLVGTDGTTVITAITADQLEPNYIDSVSTFTGTGTTDYSVTVEADGTLTIAGTGVNDGVTLIIPADTNLQGIDALERE
jgi:type IV pilus assembly protein PilA